MPNERSVLTGYKYSTLARLVLKAREKAPVSPTGFLCHKNEMDRNITNSGIYSSEIAAVLNKLNFRGKRKQIRFQKLKNKMSGGGVRGL